MANTLSLDDFLAYLHSRIGQLYVWGGNGQEATPARIKSMETSNANYQRALALYNRRKAEGLDPILIYDCSGLISRYLQDHGIVERKRNCNHLAAMCLAVNKRGDDSQLQPGDLVFRWTTKNKYYHVGVYVGGNQVIESKGRDDGVVLRSLNPGRTNYWTHWGRLPYFCVFEDEPMIFLLTTPYQRGHAYELMQQALNAAGYDCGKADGIWGPKSQAALQELGEAHFQASAMPKIASITLELGGVVYKGQLDSSN